MGLNLVEEDGDGDGAQQRLDKRRQLVRVGRIMALDWKEEKKKDNALDPDHFVLLKTTSSSAQDFSKNLMD